MHPHTSWLRSHLAAELMLLYKPCSFTGKQIEVGLGHTCVVVSISLVVFCSLAFACSALLSVSSISTIFSLLFFPSSSHHYFPFLSLLPTFNVDFVQGSVRVMRSAKIGWKSHAGYNIDKIARACRAGSESAKVNWLVYAYTLLHLHLHNKVKVHK